MEGCYCASARDGRLWRRQSTVCHRPKKITERWTNGAHAPGRTRRRGRSRENLPSAGDVINQHRWPVNEKQPESEEARPVALANALSKAVADQCQTVKTRKRNHRSVLTWFASRWRNHQPKRAKKPHSKSDVARCQTALPRGRRTPFARRMASGSRQPPQGERPMSARERECGELPSPELSPFHRKVGRGLFVFISFSSQI